MRVLLFSMPDSFEHMPTIGIRIPNGALSSLAANVDQHHDVAVADLILVQHRVRETVTELLRKHQPDVVGLSVMTFQRKTAKKIVSLVRAQAPEAKIVLGGYDPSLAPEAYPDADFIVRGEGEATFRELLREMEGSGRFAGIPGLSYLHEGEVVHNRDRLPAILSRNEVALPKRSARVLSGYQFLGNGIDVVETSRGCTYDCSFCSIIEMRGRNFFAYPIERVLNDIRDAADHGARSIFFVDDNIGLNVRRFEDLCRAIIDARLQHMEYIVQAMTSTIANHGENIVPLMARAGFKYVFLGIENILENDLQFFKASSKNSKREKGVRTGNATIQAIEYLHRYKMYVVGGLIVGTPEDNENSIRANLDFVKHYVDYPYIQHPTPYPRTPMTRELDEQGLILTRATEEYDGTTAVVRNANLLPDQLEFLRWRAERWIKARHAFQILRERPAFVLKNARGMFLHTFRGATWRTLLGFESEKKAFQRYRLLRAQERDYL